MADIKRQINNITDLKRGGTDINFVYRATTLVWQRSVVTVAKWLTSSFNLELNEPTNQYRTSAFKINFKK
jgi:hypothetical protein